MNDQKTHVLQIVKLFYIILIIGHLASSIWLWMAFFQIDNGEPSWVDVKNLREK